MSKRIIAAMGLAVVFAFSARAEQPTPTPPPQPTIVGQKDHKTEEPKQEPASEKQEPDQGQPIVQMPERKEAQKEAKTDAPQPPKKTAETKDWSLSDKIAAIASFVAFCQFIALVWTIREMRLSSQRQLRAYVFVESATPVDGTTVVPPIPEQANRPGANMTIKNFGQTPAYKIRSWSNVEVCLTGDESGLVVPKFGIISPASLAADAEMPKAVICRRKLTDDEIADIRARKKSIYLYGRIEYEDAFRKPRFTNFRYTCTGAYPADINDCFLLCRKGNETEQDV